MPIKGVSDIRRMPVLGKIRLGVKVDAGDKSHPQAVDYFVVPDEIKQYVGEMPKKLDIMFPADDMEKVAQQWLRCYSRTQGQLCKGDGETATRKVDTRTGDIAGPTTAEWILREGWGCDPEECYQYKNNQCRRVMNLLFLLPNVPGLGCWQLDTSSFYSIVNVNSCVELIKGACGRVSFIPLVLSLEPKQVSPQGMKTKTVHILSIGSELKLAEIKEMGKTAPQLITTPALDEEEVPVAIFPSQTVIQASPDAPAAVIIDVAATGDSPEPPEERTPADVTEDDVPDLLSVFRLCHHFWEMQPVDVCGVFNKTSMLYLKEAGILPWDAWLKVKGLKQPEGAV